MAPDAAPPIDSVSEFRRVLRLGLGRAILFLREHDALPYRDEILSACLEYTGYDWQVEGLRTGYLCDVLDATGDFRWFSRPILAALRESDNFRNVEQLVRLAEEFAADGSRSARAALYENLDRADVEERFLSASAIVRLDGLDGFLHVAEQMGAAIDDPERPLAEGDHWLLDSARRTPPRVRSSSPSSVPPERPR